MAQVLKQETSLGGERAKLSRENQWLHYLMMGELALAVGCLVVGSVLFFSNQSSGILVSGSVLMFLWIGHRLQTTDNQKQDKLYKAGRRGEHEVGELLEVGLDDNTLIYNDVLLKHGRKTAQIDHIVIGSNGIFVIETKNWRGRLEGRDDEPMWRQYKQEGARPVKLKSPIIQNDRHVKVLNQVLKGARIEWRDVVSLVVFSSSRTEICITSHDVPVLPAAQVVSWISQYQSHQTYDLSQMQQISNLLSVGGR